MKKLTLLIGVLVIVGAGMYSFITKPDGKNGAMEGLPPALDAKNATYTIDGESVTLVNGVSESQVALDSELRSVTRYFGNEVVHDLNDDGREDVAFLITHEKGGSGTFYYVVAALNKEAGYDGSHGFFLGDRIAPQSTDIDEGVGAEGRQRQNVIVVNYAERPVRQAQGGKPGEPMTAPPSVGKSVWLKLDPVTMQFGEVSVDFEGESR